MTFWLVVAAGLVGSWVLLTAIVGALVEPSDEEQEARVLVAAVLRERERVERVTERGR